VRGRREEEWEMDERGKGGEDYAGGMLRWGGGGCRWVEGVETGGERSIGRGRGG